MAARIASTCTGKTPAPAGKQSSACTGSMPGEVGYYTPRDALCWTGLKRSRSLARASVGRSLQPRAGTAQREGTFGLDGRHRHDQCMESCLDCVAHGRRRISAAKALIRCAGSGSLSLRSCLCCSAPSR